MHNLRMKNRDMDDFVDSNSIAADSILEVVESGQDLEDLVLHLNLR